MAAPRPASGGRRLASVAELKAEQEVHKRTSCVYGAVDLNSTDLMGFDSLTMDLDGGAAIEGRQSAANASSRKVYCSA